MTKEEAKQKVIKLLAVANGNKNPHEADTARKQAEKLIEQYGIVFDKNEDLAKAFDDIIDQIVPILDSHPESNSIFESIKPIVKNTDKQAKAKMVGKIEKGLKLWEIFVGDTPLYNGVKSIFDNALKNNNVKGKEK